MQDKQDRQDNLEDLFNHPGWEWFKQDLQRIYDNADSSLHSIGCTNREFYVGKCSTIKDILEEEKKCLGQKKMRQSIKVD